VAIAKRAFVEATLQAYDVLLLDTAGRLHIDAEMMAEVKELETALNPHERLFVVDSMAGQDAVNAAKAFNDALSLTGVILTKADGDARGGAALSVRPGHRQAHPVRRHRREIGGTGAVSAGAHRVAHPWDGDVLSLVEQVQGQGTRKRPKSSPRRFPRENPSIWRTCAIN